MFHKAQEVIDYCEKNKIRLSDYILERELARDQASREEVLKELDRMLDVMEASSQATLEKGSAIAQDLVNDFAKKTWTYAQEAKNPITSPALLRAMARALSTSETNAEMGQIVAAPTAGAAGILPAALALAKERLDLEREDLIHGILAGVGVAQFIGGYACFSGAQGGCQAECGSAAAMAAGALVQLFGGRVDQVFQGASLALVNVLGLVCDPLGGLVQFPCSVRNASGVTNAMISADLALAGVTSPIPFEEVCQAMGEVGQAMPTCLRETGEGGLAGTRTGQALTRKFFS
ncbi:MAG: L-serine ammonia-lyase, iron-sulfur-dependent, subunit alpha [Tissierellia bacterium]|nr:L-serine ammonia-lyase, iron-sulfur-dependent, subunit alpha [Tissierellia bacterium]